MLTRQYVWTLMYLDVHIFTHLVDNNVYVFYSFAILLARLFSLCVISILV